MTVKRIKREPKRAKVWESEGHVLALYVNGKRYLYSERGTLMPTGHDRNTISPYTWMHWVPDETLPCTVYPSVADVKVVYDKFIDCFEVGHAVAGIPPGACKLLVAPMNGEVREITLAMEFVKNQCYQGEHIKLSKKD